MNSTPVETRFGYFVYEPKQLTLEEAYQKSRAFLAHTIIVNVLPNFIHQCRLYGSVKATHLSDAMIRYKTLVQVNLADGTCSVITHSSEPPRNSWDR